MNKPVHKNFSEGAVLAEFAIISVALLILTFGVIEAGRVFVLQNSLTKSVESSARYLARGYEALNPDCSQAESWTDVEQRALNILVYGGANNSSGDSVVPSLALGDVVVTVKSISLSSQPVTACVIQVAAKVDYEGLFDVLVPLTNIDSVVLNARSEERYIGE